MNKSLELTIRIIGIACLIGIVYAAIHVYNNPVDLTPVHEEFSTK